VAVVGWKCGVAPTLGFARHPVRGCCQCSKFSDGQVAVWIGSCHQTTDLLDTKKVPVDKWKVCQVQEFRSSVGLRPTFVKICQNPENVIIKTSRDLCSAQTYDRGKFRPEFVSIQFSIGLRSFENQSKLYVMYRNMYIAKC